MGGRGRPGTGTIRHVENTCHDVCRANEHDNLLETSRLPGNVPDIRLSIDMPTNLQGLNNSLLVELVDTSPNQSICRAAPDAQAQLLPGHMRIRRIKDTRQRIGLIAFG